ncbi:MAG TPA: lipid II flippase MurJ [Segeticoccus sp.]|nr:lipid II flippase MurJ [Segeticoccus sp.]
MSTLLTRPTASRIAAAAGVVGAVTLLARVAGFGRWLVFSGSVGTSCTGTAYTTANLLPNVLVELAAGGALAAVAVPLVRRELATGERARADAVASVLLTWSVTVLVPVSLLLAVLARPLVGLLLPAHPCAAAAGTAAAMVVVFAPQVVLYGIAMVLTGVLHAHGRFLAAALAPLSSTLVVVAGYLGFGALTADAARPSGAALALLSGATTAGVAVLGLPLLVPVRRAGVRLRPRWRWPAGTVPRAAALAGATLVSAAALQLAAATVTRVVNEHAGAGALPAHLYVQAVYLLPYAVLSLPVALAAFPSLTAGGTTEDPAAAPRDLLSRSARAVLAAGALGTALVVAAAPQVGRVFAALDRGAGTGHGQAALAAVPDALVAVAPALPALGLVALCSRALFAHGSARAAGAGAAAGWLVVAVLPVVVLHGAGDAGPRTTLVTVGWATTAGTALAAALLAGAVARAWGRDALRRLPRTAGAAVVAAVLAAVAGRTVPAVLPGAGAATSGSSAPLPDSLVGPVGVGLLQAGLVLLVFVAVLGVLDRDVATALVRARVRARGRR